MQVSSYISALTLLTLFRTSQQFGTSDFSIRHHALGVPNRNSGHPKVTFSPSIVAPRLPSSTALNVQITDIIDADLVKEMATSRITFWLCFFGASGSAAVGRAAIPKTIDSIKLNQELSGKENAGGETLGLVGYPESIYRDDVMMILNNPMKVNQIREKYPIEGTLPAMFQYKSLVKANPDANPLAVRAVFDSLVIGINKMSVSPDSAQEKMDEFKMDLNVLKTRNNVGKLIGIGAFLFLLVLIGGADWFAFFHCWRGWFPLWPGLSAFPGSLFTSDGGITSIPNYWMSDIPDISV